MNIYTNIGSDRKQLVKALNEVLNEKLRYQGAPTFTYEYSAFTLDREGTLRFLPTADEQTARQIAEALEQRGISCSLAAEPDGSQIEDAPAEDLTTVADTRYTVRIPGHLLEGKALERFKTLIENKHSLICKVLGADGLPIHTEDDGGTLAFPWFQIESTDVEREAYRMFIDRLVWLANQLKTARLTETTVENEKYNFRCFLLRLGFIGKEYKAYRAVLMKNLGGNSAFCCGYDPRKKLRNEVGGLPMVILPPIFDFHQSMAC